ncbi:MAG: hypothetical protein AAGE96_08820 [Cyanobacteria bacterium P01_G01_bin.19]
MLQISKQAVDGQYYIYIDDEIAAYIRSVETYQQITKLIEGKLPQDSKVMIVNRSEVQDKKISLGEGK